MVKQSGPYQNQDRQIKVPIKVPKTMAAIALGFLRKSAG